MHASAAACAIALAAGLAGCSATVDLKRTLQVSDVSGGYYDAGVVNGRNKLIPTITVTLHKSTAAELRPLSLNVVFKRLPPKGDTGAPSAQAEEDFDEKFIQTVAFNGMQTDPLTVRANAGYTGDPPQSRADMLAHSQFRDIRVHLFAKHSASQWVEIAQYTLPRQLLVH